MAKRKWKANDIIQLLRQRHSGHEWAFVEQVPNGTGSAHNRTCDALAMSLWPSRGLHLHGFEVKVGRSDWLKEIQDVSKAAAFSVSCHYWWIAAPKEIVELSELPSDWGLISPTASGNLRVKKPATYCDTPATPSFSLLAGIFRACCKQSPLEQQLAAARSEGYSAGREEERRYAKSRRSSDLDHATTQLEWLQRSIAEFEKNSGIKIDAYNGGKIGNIVAAIDRVGSVSRMADGFENTANRLESSVKEIRGAVEALRGM